MKVNERRAYILEKTRQEKFASIESLSAIFSVSVQIIRKDVNALCELGYLKRVRGGVEMPTNKENISYDNRKIIHYDAKKQIAKMVAKEIPDGASLFFSIGTTPEIVAKELLKHKNLKIFTNNLNVALVCCENESFEITLLGGKVRNKHRDILGKNIEEFFSSYHVDFGIFGVGAIEKDGVLLDFTEDELLARETIKRCSRKAFLVADYSKFDRKAYIKGGDIKEIDSFFCDQIPPKPIFEMIKAHHINLFLPQWDNE